MKRASIGFLVAIGVSAAIGRSAYAATEIIESSGVSCNPQKADVGKISYSSQFGATNDSATSTARVFCPVVGQFAGPSDVNILVRDRSAPGPPLRTEMRMVPRDVSTRPRQLGNEFAVGLKTFSLN